MRVLDKEIITHQHSAPPIPMMIKASTDQRWARTTLPWVKVSPSVPVRDVKVLLVEFHQALKCFAVLSILERTDGRTCPSLIVCCMLHYLVTCQRSALAQRQRNGCTSRWLQDSDSPGGQCILTRRQPYSSTVGNKKAPSNYSEHWPMPCGVDYHYLVTEGKDRKFPDNFQTFPI